MIIAKTILKQIQTLTPQSVFWSWGASKLESVSENQIQGINEEYQGALKFYVRGLKHKGHVIVSLNGSDLYTVTIGHVRKSKIKPKNQIKDVYFEELSQVIDNLIEKQDNYQ